MRETPSKKPWKPAALFLGMMGTIFAFPVWIMIPDHVKYPDREASSSMYADAERVFDKSERRVFGSGPDDYYDSTYRGYCPDLSVMTAKALLDKRLTLSEVHELQEEAHRLSKEANLMSQKNDALKAAGQKPLPNSINCPNGSALFQ